MSRLSISGMPVVRISLAMGAYPMGFSFAAEGWFIAEPPYLEK